DHGLRPCPTGRRCCRIGRWAGAGTAGCCTLFNHFYPSLSIPFYTTASIIGFSRVYNGVHYPSDVMAGSILGFCSARIGLGIFI
ncbi:MAG: phosphatase PAP2 family protein, partial [bacterium]